MRSEKNTEASDLQNRLLESIIVMQNDFIKRGIHYGWCKDTIDNLLFLSESEFGFICELLKKDDGTPYIKSHGITNIAWNEQTRQFYEKNKEKGLEFFNFESLWGKAITTGEPVISNDPDSDNRRGRYPKDNGHPKLKSFLGLPIKGSEGKVVGVMGVANRPNGYDQEMVGFLIPFLNSYGILIEKYRSDQQRKKAEEDLKESEKRLHTILDQSPFPIAVVDTNDEKILYWSQSARETFGHDPKVVSEWYALAYPDPVYREEVIKRWKPFLEKASMTHKAVNTGEYRIECKDGSTKICELYAQFIPGNLIVTLNDITARKQSGRNALMLKSAIDQAPVGIALADADINIFYCNPEGLSIRGGEIDNLVDIPKDTFNIWQVFTMDGNPYEVDNLPLVKAMKSGQTIKENFLVKDQAGVTHICDVIACPVFENGEIMGGLVVFQDVTEQERIVKSLQQSQKMESVGRLAGGVAHDFNNMLGVILGHTELAMLKAGEDNNDLTPDLKEIQKAATRSADITKQLLAFARKQTISPKQIDLNDTVESMLNMLRRLIGEDIDLVWQPSAHIWPVKMDPSQIDQILANLCINARDAIAGVGKLTIETGRKSFDEEYCSEHPGFTPGDFVLLAVSDNGCGMDKDTLDNIFEPFFTTKEVGKGTGLGLATIYGICKQNNGFINVYSEPDQGTTFRIYLPGVITDEDIDKAVPEKKTAAGGTETILLVEDEPTILRMARMMLERNGYTVLTAATPAEALEKAKSHSSAIDLLMTDVVMPEMNGRDLAEQLIPLYLEIKLLFMSGYTANVIADQGVLDDGVAFIQKPFSMADMTKKVREVLDMASDKS